MEQVLNLGRQLYTLLEPCSSDLHTLLRKQHPAGLPSSGDVRQLGAQILNALAFMHERQVLVHWGVGRGAWGAWAHTGHHCLPTG
jgi:hypothetical protein